MERPKITPLETKEELLRKSQRKTKELPIRNTFVQKGTRSKPVPSTLSILVGSHDVLALDLYLLTLAAASAPPYALIQPARTLARALGPKPVGVPTISKAWTRLEGLGLISRGKRSGRLATISLHREDGSGEPYTHPGAAAARERYFKMPFAYWLDGFDEILSLPAKAMLLIALSLSDDFYLPYEKAKPWYGLSAETAEKGLRELERRKLIEYRKEYKRAPLAPLGYTEHRTYRLRPPMRSRRKSEPVLMVEVVLGGDNRTPTAN
jgi:hypothetical protein